MSEKKILAGTYTDTGSKGIYSFTENNGIIRDPNVFAETGSPKYISVSSGLVASIGKGSNGSGGASVFDDKGHMLSERNWEATTSCWIGWHEGNVYTANYHTGFVSRLKYSEGELKVDKTVDIRDNAGCHQVLFHGNQILVPCLFMDRIMIFDGDLEFLGFISFPAGTGPRHGVFSEDKSVLYLISELSNELFVMDTEDWSVRSVMPVLMDGRMNIRGGAAVRLCEAKKKLYVSTRRADVISVIDLEKMKTVQEVYSGGKGPRDFILCDHSLIAANRYSDSIVCFELKEDGTIGAETSRISVPQPVSLAVLES